MAGASPAGGQEWQCPPDFRLYSPPDFFLASPPTEFLWEEEVDVFRQKKNVKACGFGQKKPRISAKTFFFGDHLILGGKFVISARKSLRISAKTIFFNFGDLLFLGGKFVISASKSPFAPPPISRIWRRPWSVVSGQLSVVSGF